MCTTCTPVAHRAQKRRPGLPELELHRASGPSARAASALNHLSSLKPLLWRMTPTWVTVWLLLSL